MRYALPVKTRYKMTENVRENEVLDCPSHWDKICILRRLKKLKYSSGLVNSLKYETDDRLSSCSKFPERPKLEELERDKPVLEIEHLRDKVTDEQLEAIKDVLDWNEDVLSKHKADIGCCNFVENEIELEESAVPHRKGARRMTANMSDAFRKEIETLLEYDTIEPSESLCACGVVITKKKGDQLRFCCDFRYLNSVTVKDAYPIPRIDQSLSKLGTQIFLQLSIWVRPLAGPTEEAGQGQNWVCLQARADPMEEDALWPLQLHGYVPTIDGTRIDKCNEEIWQPVDVLRGPRGNSDTYTRGPHRATR